MALPHIPPEPHPGWGWGMWPHWGDAERKSQQRLAPLSEVQHWVEAVWF